MSSICGKNRDAADGGGTGMGSDGTAAVALQTQTDLVVGTARALCAGKVPALYRICVKTGDQSRFKSLGLYVNIGRSR